MKHLEERESLLKRTEEKVTRQHEAEREFHIRHSRPEAGTQELRVKREEVMTRVLSNLHLRYCCPYGFWIYTTATTAFTA